METSEAFHNGENRQRLPLAWIAAVVIALLVLALLGYSINTLTLFGLVLAIGLVVDDAIVVVEHILYLMENEGLRHKEAAIRAMEEVSGAVIATTLVLLTEGLVKL